MHIPFVDVGRGHLPFKIEILKRIESLIDQGAFVLGEDVARFEKNFSTFLGAQHAIGVSSGLDALRLALQGLDIGAGDEVIVPAHTFIATALAVSQVGARVILVDVDPDTCTLDIQAVEQALSPQTKAVIAVHLYGQSANMGALLSLARARNFAVIEDSAQAHGALYGQEFCGTMGTIGCFSFYPTKNLGAFGEGGMVVTGDAALADKIKALRNVGQKEKNNHAYLGSNARLHTLQAAVLDVKLNHLKSQNEERVAIAQHYDHLLQRTPLSRPKNGPNRNHVYHLYVVQAGSFEVREALKEHLTKAHIGTAVHYPTPIHLQPCYASLGYKRGDFPVAEKLARVILSLPMFPGLRDDEVKQVASQIEAFYA